MDDTTGFVKSYLSLLLFSLIIHVASNESLTVHLASTVTEQPSYNNGSFPRFKNIPFSFNLETFGCLSGN